MKASELVEFLNGHIKNSGDFEAVFAFGSEDHIEIYEKCVIGVPPEDCEDVDDTTRLILPDVDSEVVGVIRLKPVHVH